MTLCVSGQALIMAVGAGLLLARTTSRSFRQEEKEKELEMTRRVGW